MSASIVSFGTAQARRSRVGYLRLRLKPPHRSGGFVQGAWWPRTDQLHVELPPLLAALSSRIGPVSRAVYDETIWGSAPSRIDLGSGSVVLEGSIGTSTDVVSLFGEGLSPLVLLVVPPYTNPTRAYTTVMKAANPDDMSTPDELLGIGQREALDRRLALLAQQRWESEGGALPRLDDERMDDAVFDELQAAHCVG